MHITKTIVRALGSAILMGASLSLFSYTGADVLTDISQREKPVTLKILIEHQAARVILETKGRYYLYNPATGTHITTSAMGKRQFIYPEEEGLHWGDLYPLFQLRVVPGDSQSTIFVNGRQYRGCVEIYNVNGTLYIINEVDVENYLKSTLTYQFTDTFPQEVMDAIAIVARTQAYYYLAKNPDAFWHADAKKVGYDGLGVTLQNIHVDRAVENTRHTVLTYKEGVFAATWTNNCGGKTANFNAIFRKNALTPNGVTAPFAAHDRTKNNWSFSLTKQRLSELLNIDRLRTIELYLEPKSNKVYAVRLSTETKEFDMDFFSFQKMVGENNLLSNDFSVIHQGDKVLFSGFGEGHGVGLCLYSAKLMAEHGSKTPAILSAFFPETKLERVQHFSELHIGGEPKTTSTD